MKTNKKVSSLTALAALVGLTMGGFAGAATTSASAPTGQSALSTSSIANTWKALQDSPLSFSLLADTASTRDDDNKITGISSTDIAYIGYKFNADNSMKLENRWVYTNAQQKDSTTTFSRTVLSYKRSNLLTEKDNGVSLSLTGELRYVPDAVSRVKGNSPGLYRAVVGLSKSVGALDLAASTYIAKLFVRDSSIKTKTDNYIELVASESYNFNDTFSAYFSQDAYLQNTQANVNEARSLTLETGIGHNVMKDLSLSYYVGASPIDRADSTWQRDNEWLKKYYLGLTVSLTVF